MSQNYGEKDVTERYRGVANSLAMLTIASEGYTHLDRLANALNPETVIRVIYDVKRSLDVLLKRKDIQIEKMHDDKNRIFWKFTIGTDQSKKIEYSFYGMANEENMRHFIEEATNDLAVARKIAAYAMSIVASQKLYNIDRMEGKR